MGFDGKTLIHPAQIDPANRAFSPSEAVLAEAQGDRGGLRAARECAEGRDRAWTAR